jgi:CBS domain-containing protein
MSAKTAADIMTRDVKTIPADATLQEVATLLTTHNISGAPVVDESGRVVGIISESDLISEAKKRSSVPHVAAFGIFIPQEETLDRLYHGGATLIAEEVMSKRIVSVPQDTPLDNVAATMVRVNVNRLPVINEDGDLVGIITRHDLLRGLYDLPTSPPDSVPQ